MSLKGGNILGVTWTSTSINEADIALNTDFTWATDGGGYDVETVFLHEEGRALGLGHSDDIDAVMYPSYQGVAHSLTQDEFDGVTFKYPAVGAITLAITTSSLMDGIVDASYSATVTAIGGTTPYAPWVITSGSVPDGLKLNVTTDEISGSPALSALGEVTFTDQVTDSNGTQDTAVLSITVGDAPVVGAVTVSSIDYSGAGGKNKDVHMLINVGLSVTVADALVSVDVYRNDALYGSATGATDTNGVAHFRATNAPAGVYRTVVTSVTGAGGDWDGLYPPGNGTTWP